MSFLRATFTILALSLGLGLSSISNAGDLIAGINYGDTRDTVTTKLKASKLVNKIASDGLFSIAGLDGSFTTANELAGQKYKLYFDWTETKELKELKLRSTPLPPASFSLQLKEAWLKANTLLSAMHGKPDNTGEYPPKHQVQKGHIHYTHQWESDNGYIYLGVGNEADQYSIYITFSSVALIEQSK